MRITTGVAKGKNLKAPKIPEFRAVQDVAKMSVFSILGDKIVDSMVLDMFSGSGNLGIESLSRGAKWCDFVDGDKRSTIVIEDNVKDCGFEDKSEVFLKDAVKYAANSMNNYDVIFLDPFYSDTSHVFLMKNIEEILNEDGFIIFFHGENLDLDKVLKNTDLKVTDERRFGKSYFSIIKHTTR